MKITFNQANKSLSHLQSQQQENKPPLLSVKGWDKAKVIYQLRQAISDAFKGEIERLDDLRSEAAKKQQSGEDISDIVDEMNELAVVEKDVDIPEKLTRNKFEDVMDSEIMMDLDFAIDFK
jgi:hypothetical protein